MSYYRRLAYSLRRRHLSEVEVARVLIDVRDLSTDAAKPPLEEFGRADVYATGFDEGRARWSWTRAVSSFTYLLAFGFVIVNAELRRDGSPMLLPWWAVLTVSTGVLAAGTGLRHLIEHRLPRGFARAATGQSLTTPAEEPTPSHDVPGGTHGSADGTDPAGPTAYYRALAFHLRLRQLPETEVSRILEEVCELSQDGGSRPEEEFGPAQEYAAQFERRKRRHDAGVVGFSACVVLGALIGLTNMLAGLGVGERLLSPGASLLAFASLVIGGATFAVWYTHRLPRGLRERLAQGVIP